MMEKGITAGMVRSRIEIEGQTAFEVGNKTPFAFLFTFGKHSLVIP